MNVENLMYVSEWTVNQTVYTIYRAVTLRCTRGVCCYALNSWTKGMYSAPTHPRLSSLQKSCTRTTVCSWLSLVSFVELLLCHEYFPVRELLNAVCVLKLQVARRHREEVEAESRSGCWKGSEVSPRTFQNFLQLLYKLMLFTRRQAPHCNSLDGRLSHLAFRNQSAILPNTNLCVFSSTPLQLMLSTHFSVINNFIKETCRNTV